MITRSDTNDATSVAEDVEEYAKQLVIPYESHVLDIGGHIGMFAELCYNRGATRVTSVEPDPDNAALHRRNMARRPQHILIQAAAIGDGSHAVAVPFFQHQGRNKARHSLLRSVAGEDSTEIVVAAVTFQALLRFVQPRVLKVDCEGVEYAFRWELPSSVEYLAVEFHELPQRAEQKDSILYSLTQQKFRCTYITVEKRSYVLHVFRRF